MRVEKIMYNQAGFIFMGALTIDSGPAVYFKQLRNLLNCLKSGLSGDLC